MKSTIITLLATCLTLGIAHAKSEKPNIIVILADDMGYADAGFTGATDIQTPNLDKIAASGVTFTQGYANHPYCGPSRAALLSGRYQHRFGFETNPAYDPANPILGIDPGEILFPKRLQKAGYVTGGIGKWHLGAAAEFHPNKRGFDYYYGFLGGGHDYFKIDLTAPVKEAYLQGLVRNGRPADFEGYLTTALSRDAAKFIDDHKEKPFFLYIAYNAPHAPLQAPADVIEKYKHIQDRNRRIYAAMVDTMDQGIGEVIAALERNGLRDNTLIAFMSDNGGPQGKDGKDGNGSSNGDFRGGKGNLFDGGVHVPFMASWPARIPAGTIFKYPVMAIDVARTAVEAAGADALAAPAMEGVDLLPFVLGKKTEAPRDALFWRDGNGQRWSVLTSRGDKYLKDTPKGKPELYHLPDDRSETKNIIAKNPELASELQARWDKWNSENVSNRMVGYKEYHHMRDEFYSEAIADEAKKSGYKPEVKSSF